MCIYATYLLPGCFVGSMALAILLKFLLTDLLMLLVLLSETELS